MPKKIDPHDPPPDFDSNKFKEVFLRGAFNETEINSIKKVFPNARVSPIWDAVEDPSDRNTMGFFPTTAIVVKSLVRSANWKDVFYNRNHWEVQFKWIENEIERNIQANLDFISKL